jgi:hypothetical protein
MRAASLTVATKVANVLLDATSGHDLLLSEPSLFIGFLLENLDMTSSFDNSRARGSKSLVLFRDMSHEHRCIQDASEQGHLQLPFLPTRQREPFHEQHRG